MSSPLFVYLHGFASGPSSAKARFFRERLAARGVDLQVPDLNQGEEGFRSLTISRSIAQVHDLIDGSGAERAVLIGSSLGGYTAALASTLDPRIEAVVAMCPALDLPARWTQWLDQEGIDAWRSSGALEVDHHAYERKEKVGFGLYRDALGHAPYPRVEVPTLVLHGILDQEVPVGTSRKFAALSPQVRLVEYESDHALLDVLEPIWEEASTFLAPWLDAAISKA